MILCKDGLNCELNQGNMADPLDCILGYLTIKFHDGAIRWICNGRSYLDKGLAMDSSFLETIDDDDSFMS